MKRKLLLVSLTCVCVFLLSACGGATAATMRLRKTEGEVQVNDDKDKSLEVREDLALYSGYGVGTSVKSYSWIDLDSVKLVKLDESSQTDIEKDGGSLKLQLKSGNIFFHVAEPLGDDESMEIRTSTLAIGIRGTCGWVENLEDENASRVYLLEGKVECTPVNDGADGQSVFVAAGEVASLTGGGEITVEKFGANAIPAFVRDEAEENEDLERLIQDIPEQGGTDASSFASWDQAGLEDHVMDWKDEALAQAMAEVTGISDREIMLGDVWEITRLELNEKGISNISALGELTNLTELYLNVNQISDISALGNLTSLTVLELVSNQISDISPLRSLMNLTVLELGKNQISDISTLGNLTNLTKLYLYVNQISDISPLRSLTNLTVLFLNVNQISDISALGNLKNLTVLELGENQISDISALGNLKNLSELNLYVNQISDISALGNLTNLTLLNLGQNQISDISALGNLKNLSRLYLYVNQISDFGPIRSLTNLTDLSTVANPGTY